MELNDLFASHPSSSRPFGKDRFWEGFWEKSVPFLEDPSSSRQDSTPWEISGWLRMDPFLRLRGSTNIGIAGMAGPGAIVDVWILLKIGIFQPAMLVYQSIKPYYRPHIKGKVRFREWTSHTVDGNQKSCKKTSWGWQVIPLSATGFTSKTVVRSPRFRTNHQQYHQTFGKS